MLFYLLSQFFSTFRSLTKVTFVLLQCARKNKTCCRDLLLIRILAALNINKKMQWEPPGGQGFLGCRSKCLVYTEVFFGQLGPNQQKIDARLNQLFQLSSAGIPSK